MILTTETAEDVAARWRDAWNSHDVDRVLDCYVDDVEFWSPFVAEFVHPEGRLTGKDQLRSYVAGAFRRRPDLKFPKPRHVAVGVSSITLVYDSMHRSVAVETMVLDKRLLVRQAICHYEQTQP